MNANRDTLRATVADFFEVDPTQVGSSFTLNRPKGESSVARAALDSAIRRRVGRKSLKVYTAATLGQIEAELFPDFLIDADAPTATSIAPAVQPVNSTSFSQGIRCGIDLEAVAALPKADDYWEHHFYQDMFAPSEIAYCISQDSPPLHFAARWCAKEALRKCDSAFQNVPMNAIEVVRSLDGQPSLRHRLAGGEIRELPHAVSLSHTNEMAMAAVISKAESAAGFSAPPPPPAPQNASSDTINPPLPLPSPAAMIASLMGILALGVAVFALYRTYVHG